MLVAVAGAVSFVAALDMGIVTVALADIGTSLRVSPQAAQWAVLGYQLAVVALLLPAGSWLDGVGIRPALLGAMTVFAGFSAAAAFAPSLGWLVAARIVQGAAGSVLFVLTPVLAARSVRPELLGRATSVPATLGPLGAVLGPAVGGVLLDHWGWHAVFLVKLPFCAAVLAIAWRAAPRGGRLLRPGVAAVADATLIGVAMASVLLALTVAVDHPAWSLVGLFALLPLAGWLRRASGRQVSATLTGSRTWSVNGTVLALGTASIATQYLVVLHLQHDGGISATATGLTVLAFPLAMGVAGPAGGWLADRFGHRRIAIVGAAVTTAGLVLLVAGAEWEPLDIAWRLAVAGFGMALHGGPTQALVMASVTPQRTATAGSVILLARSLGFTVGPALATAASGLAGGGTAGTTAGLGCAILAAGLATTLLALGARGAVSTTVTTVPTGIPSTH